MSEWKEVTLKDITQLVIDYRGKTPLKLGGNWSDHGYRALSAKNVKTGIIVAEESIRYVDEDLYKKWMKDEVQRGDILITSEAPFGEVFYWNSDEKIVLSQRLFDVRVKRDVCAQYVYYYMTSYPFQAELRSRASGTTVLGLKQPELLKAKVVLPDYETQQKIAAQLSEIDNKIAINRRICENLEAQAQALFKHWFIDFAPFKDGKFVESDLGMIPEGWRVGTYDEIIQKTISGDWGKEKPEGNYTHKVACIRGCDFQDVKMGLRGKTPERFILEKNYNTKHFNDKDVLVEISGGTATVSTGRICPVSQLLIDKYNGDIVCTNFCRLVRPCFGYSSYLYYSWRYKYDRKVMFGYENGTSGIKNFSIKDFTSREQLIIPKLSDLQIFEGMIEHIHTHIQNMGSESAKLATLRDTLLPKLMSGQIKL